MNKESTMKVTAANGVPFTVRLVRKGDAFGKDFQLQHSTFDPLVEFYDRRYDFTKYGQFVARYHMASLVARDRGNDLCLEGHVPE